MSILFSFLSPVNVSPLFGVGILPTNPAPMPVGFLTHAGSYIPSDEESTWATLDAERQENERQEARWEAMAQESYELDHAEAELVALRLSPID